jgi:hypothetical protein
MPDGVKTTIYLPETLKQRIEEEARVERRSLNAEVVRALEKVYTYTKKEGQ